MAVYPTSNEIVTTLGWLFEKPELYKRLVRNWENAGECQGCEFLHLGFNVDHNHCERRRCSTKATYVKGKDCIYFRPATYKQCTPHKCRRLEKLIKLLEKTEEEARELLDKEY